MIILIDIAFLSSIYGSLWVLLGPALFFLRYYGSRLWIMDCLHCVFEHVCDSDGYLVEDGVDRCLGQELCLYFFGLQCIHIRSHD